MQLGRVPPIRLADVDWWCRSHLGAGVAEELFRDGYLSAVLGVRLVSGRGVVVKVRPPTDRLAACWAVYRRLFERGFACAEPLVGPAPLGELVATAEALVDGGELYPASGRRAAPFAGALARATGLAPRPDELPSLYPAPPWTAWNHDEPGLWPWPDDRDVDLNSAGGPAWIDEAGHAARERLRRTTGALVVGHGDWYTGNLRWDGDRLRVAYDWDSVIADRETVIAGLAAAVFPATRAGTEATVEETDAFLEAYQVARGRRFSADEIEECWAAGLWIRSFDAKKQAATEGAPRSLHEDEARERLRRAGAAPPSGSRPRPRLEDPRAR